MRRHTAELGLAVLLVIVFAVTLLCASYWAFWDTSPVLADNRSSVEPVISREGGLRVRRQFLKLRDVEDCPLLLGEHWIVSEDGARIRLTENVGGTIITDAVPGDFTMVFRWPAILPPGVYRHEVRLVYQCNPLRTQTMEVSSNWFKVE